jgi:hypothetical protein
MQVYIVQQYAQAGTMHAIQIMTCSSALPSENFALKTQGDGTVWIYQQASGLCASAECSSSQGCYPLPLVPCSSSSTGFRWVRVLPSLGSVA